jgi:hypothetical protein
MKAESMTILIRKHLRVDTWETRENSCDTKKRDNGRQKKRQSGTKKETMGDIGRQKKRQWEETMGDIGRHEAQKGDTDKTETRVNSFTKAVYDNFFFIYKKGDIGTRLMFNLQKGDTWV